jgi:hypothetical protein
VPAEAEPFVAHGVEGGQKAGLEQLFGRDARTPAGPVQFLEEGRVSGARRPPGA